MAKINFSFNGKDYSIDEASLSSATAALKSHLSTVMNGTGATITLDGVAYNIDVTKLSAEEDKFAAYLSTIGGEVPEEERLEGDGAEFHKFAPTALTFRSTAPLNELQEIKINGVTVDPSNYTLEEGSTIVTLPIEYLKTLDVDNYEITVVSDSKSAKGGFTVKAPELNEHGFYYNQPYSANLPMFGGDTAFFVREDGTYDIITVGKLPDTGEYTMDGNNIVATHPMLGTITCSISSDGTEVFCNELQTAFKLSNSTAIAADDDYVYVYMEDLGGYEVKAIDKTKAEYGAIKTGINGINTVKLADWMFGIFDDNNNMIENPYILSFPQIPDTVIAIGKQAFRYCTGLTGITIPEGVTSIELGTFINCINLVSITIPSTITSIGINAFGNCPKLDNMVFNGTVEQWNSISKEGEINDATTHVSYVQCSDGQVAI